MSWTEMLHSLMNVPDSFQCLPTPVVAEAAGVPSPRTPTQALLDARDGLVEEQANEQVLEVEDADDGTTPAAHRKAKSAFSPPCQ